MRRPAYFHDRFDAHPWFLTYLEHPTDGPFWRDRSLRYGYGAIQVPVYLVGGLLDGYRDATVRMLQNLQVPVVAEIGPWTHAWPDDGTPGPNCGWRARAVRWWDHWLKGRDTGMLREPRFAVFTGAVLNGTQRDSPLHPEPLAPGHDYDLTVPLHFTTWIFRPGHRIRLAVSNAQFPMIWPARSGEGMAGALSPDNPLMCARSVQRSLTGC